MRVLVSAHWVRNRELISYTQFAERGTEPKNDTEVIINLCGRLSKKCTWRVCVISSPAHLQRKIPIFHILIIVRLKYREIAEPYFTLAFFIHERLKVRSFAVLCWKRILKAILLLLGNHYWRSFRDEQLRNCKTPLV